MEYPLYEVYLVSLIASHEIVSDNTTDTRHDVDVPMFFPS